MKKNGVVIVTYNRLELLKEAVSACLEQTVAFSEILVINNNSSDGTKEYLDSLNKKNVKVMHLKENIGGAGGFYEGLKYYQKSKLDYVLLIDDDAILSNNYNEEICKSMDKDDKNISGYSGIVKANGEIQFEHRRHLKKKNSFKTINSEPKDYERMYFDYDLSTFCGLYVPVKLIKKIGLPKKEFFIWFDDTEYSLRLAPYGKIRNVNSTYLNHKTSITVANSSYTWKSYYGLRNQIYIIKNYFSKLELFAFIFSMFIRIIGGFVVGFITRNKYYKNVSFLYYHALVDGVKNNLGKSSIYLPTYKLK